jgi:secretion/DNA translocation related TadE-like protein
VWVLVACLVTWSVATFGLSIGGVIEARHRAASAADLAALAAAAVLAEGAGDPCAEAARVAAGTRARLVACERLGDGSLQVVVEAALPRLVARWTQLPPARARARAGGGGGPIADSLDAHVRADVLLPEELVRQQGRPEGQLDVGELARLDEVTPLLLRARTSEGDELDALRHELRLLLQVVTQRQVLPLHDELHHGVGLRDRAPVGHALEHHVRPDVLLAEQLVAEQSGAERQVDVCELARPEEIPGFTSLTRRTSPRSMPSSGSIGMSRAVASTPRSG